MTLSALVQVIAYRLKAILASLSLPILQTLAIEGGYSGIAALSNFSAVMLLSGCAAFLHDPANWTGAGIDLTESEINEINELVDQAEDELILSAVGLIMPIANAAVPEYMLLCDGTQYLRVDYPELFEVLDPVFIVDPDNFVTPDLRDRFVLGSPTTPVGNTGGTNTHTLSVSQLPSHSHLYEKETIGVLAEGLGVPVPATLPVTLPSATTLTGSGTSVNHQNPYIALLYGIIAGR